MIEGFPVMASADGCHEDHIGVLILGVPTVMEGPAREGSASEATFVGLTGCEEFRGSGKKFRSHKI